MRRNKGCCPSSFFALPLSADTARRAFHNCQRFLAISIFRGNTTFQIAAIILRRCIVQLHRCANVGNMESAGVTATTTIGSAPFFPFFCLHPPFSTSLHVMAGSHHYLIARVDAVQASRVFLSFSLSQTHTHTHMRAYFRRVIALAQRYGVATLALD